MEITKIEIGTKNGANAVLIQQGNESIPVNCPVYLNGEKIYPKPVQNKKKRLFVAIILSLVIYTSLIGMAHLTSLLGVPWIEITLTLIWMAISIRTIFYALNKK